MFRPYNIKSLTAWTLGSLAGNRAYYRAKGACGATPYISGPEPAEILALNHRMASIQKIFTDILADLKTLNWVGKNSNEFDLTDFVRLFAFQEWLSSQRMRLRAEIGVGCAEAVRAHLIKRADVAAARAHLDDFINVVAETSTNFRKEIMGWMRTGEDRKRILEFIQQQLRYYYVDESKYTLASTQPERRLHVGPPA